MAKKLTPMMQQYLLKKEEYPDSILMFRLGDFYEMFFEDAETAARELEIVLTGRDCGLEERAPMCGVPHHSVDNYIKTLIEKGYKVAICEQLTDPAESKGLVERDVVRVITPGTVIEDYMMQSDSNNYIMSIYSQQDQMGFAWSDVSTGEFYIGQAHVEDITSAASGEIARLHPAEIITEDGTYMQLAKPLSSPGSPICTNYGAWAFDLDNAKKLIQDQFGASVVDNYVDKAYFAGMCAAGGLLAYLKDTQKVSLSHINKVDSAEVSAFVELDANTQRNLELTRPMMGGSGKGTLLAMLNRCKTSGGTRLLRKWIEQPLRDVTRINLRLDAVGELLDYNKRIDMRAALDDIHDIERLCSKISYGTLNAREAAAIGQTLQKLPDVKEILSACETPLLAETGKRLDVMQDVCAELSRAIVENPPVSVREGGLIREGYSAEVDELKAAYTQGRDWLSELEQREREATGIKNLKIGYNRVFGYYIEITKSQVAQAPYRYVRKQTLTNAERYITDELKTMEEKILGAEEKCMRLEYQLFVQLRDMLLQNLTRLQDAAKAVALCDCLQSLAMSAFEHNYTRPTINTEGRIQIKEGRHPVVERTVDSFVPNDALLDEEDNRFLIITGPNMSGKSTYMRQVAVLTIMAHMGSYVPAKQADISIVDRVFTRVGASDDLASGRSTFMVEMVELANILNNATKDSLIILDEIGRGTSTFDGLSIAWAACEYICDQQRLGAKTLFATHYHELTELEGELDGVKNYCILAREAGDDVIFLHRIVRGGTDNSFGIQVAKLAGVPGEVVERSKGILGQLKHLDVDGHIRGLNDSAGPEDKAEQTGLFGQVDFRKEEVLEQLRQLDITALTPLDAINLLNGMKEKASKL